MNTIWHNKNNPDDKTDSVPNASEIAEKNSHYKCKNQKSVSHT